MLRLSVAIALVVSLAAALVPAGPVMAATPIYVNAATGNNAWDGQAPAWDGAHGPKATIKAGIGAVDADGTLVVAAGTYNEWNITVNKSLTIEGGGAGVTIVDAQHSGRVLNINGAHTVTISGLTIRNGKQGTGHGGGVYNNGGTLTMTDCAVSDNTAQASGGGIMNFMGGSTIMLNRCLISGNSASFGGGMHNFDETATMINCTVSGNTAAGGAGIYLWGSGSTLAMTSCTVTDNEATGYGYGGGIYNAGTVTLKCTIMYNNYASAGANIYNDGTVNPPIESLIGPPDPSPDPCPDPRLGPLQDNGGSTSTHALLSGSAAVDACRNNCDVATDQRGVARPQGARCDIGAYEWQPEPSGAPTIPAISLWGTAALAVVLAAFLTLSLRRRLVTGNGVRP